MILWQYAPMKRSFAYISRCLTASLMRGVDTHRCKVSLCGGHVQSCAAIKVARIDADARLDKSPQQRHVALKDAVAQKRRCLSRRHIQPVQKIHLSISHPSPQQHRCTASLLLLKNCKFLTELWHATSLGLPAAKKHAQLRSYFCLGTAQYIQ